MLCFQTDKLDNNDDDYDMLTSNVRLKTDKSQLVLTHNIYKNFKSGPFFGPYYRSQVKNHSFQGEMHYGLGRHSFCADNNNGSYWSPNLDKSCG